MSHEEISFAIPVTEPGSWHVVILELDEFDRPSVRWAPIVGWRVQGEETFPITILGFRNTRKDVVDKWGRVYCWHGDHWEWRWWNDWWNYRARQLRKDQSEKVALPPWMQPPAGHGNLPPMG